MDSKQKLVVTEWDYFLQKDKSSLAICLLCSMIFHFIQPSCWIHLGNLVNSYVSIHQRLEIQTMWTQKISIVVLWEEHLQIHFLASFVCMHCGLATATYAVRIVLWISYNLLSFIADRHIFCASYCCSVDWFCTWNSLVLGRIWKITKDEKQFMHRSLLLSYPPKVTNGTSMFLFFISVPHFSIRYLSSLRKFGLSSFIVAWNILLNGIIF